MCVCSRAFKNKTYIRVVYVCTSYTYIVCICTEAHLGIGSQNNYQLIIPIHCFLLMYQLTLQKIFSIYQGNIFFKYVELYIKFVIHEFLQAYYQNLLTLCIIKFKKFTFIYKTQELVTCAYMRAACTHFSHFFHTCYIAYEIVLYPFPNFLSFFSSFPFSFDIDRPLFFSVKYV